MLEEETGALCKKAKSLIGEGSATIATQKLTFFQRRQRFLPESWLVTAVDYPLEWRSGARCAVQQRKVPFETRRSVD